MRAAYTVLNELRDYLAKALADGVLQLSRGSDDGRINSQSNERQISDALRLHSISQHWEKERGLLIEVSPPRYWFDFVIRDTHSEQMLPVNVKVSTMRSADNLSSKEGMFFAMTGCDPMSTSINSWESFCKVLAEKLDSGTQADYYFLIVNKSVPGDVFWTSLKQIPELVPNGNNPPFQCNWSRNRERAMRSEQEACRYILEVLHQTFQLRAGALKSFENHLLRWVQKT